MVKHPAMQLFKPSLLFRAFAVGSLCLAALTGLRAGDVPPMPADGINDDAHAISVEQRRTLAEEMKAFQQRTGVVVVIDVISFLPNGETTNERCRALVNSWIGHRPGVVFCLNRSVNPVPFIMYSQELFERYPEPDLSQAAGETTDAMSKITAPENRLPVGAKVMMGRLNSFEKSRLKRQQMFHRREWEMMAGFAVFMVAGGGLAWLIIRARSRHDRAKAVKHYFPDAEVAQRFGAPAGGGIVAEVSYIRAKH